MRICVMENVYTALLYSCIYIMPCLLRNIW